MQRNSTTASQALADTLWSQHQDNASRWIALSDRASLRADEVKTVLCGYYFQRCDTPTRTTATGHATQCAMTLTRKIDPIETITVVCTAE